MTETPPPQATPAPAARCCTRGIPPGRFDTRYSGRDADAAAEVAGNDPSSDAVPPPMSAPSTTTLIRALGIAWDRAHVNVNREAGQEWDWRNGTGEMGLEKWDWRGTLPEGAPRWPACGNVAPTVGRSVRPGGG